MVNVRRGVIVYSMSSEGEFARSFLKRGPPYLGDSHFRHKDTVKANGGRWNGELKKWEARSNDDLEKLIRSKVWLPIGMSEMGAQSILEQLHSGKRTTLNNKKELLFDRRGPQHAKFNFETDVVRFNDRTCTFARQCSVCEVVLDSRLQFGLECDCHDGACWTSCSICSKPIRFSEECGCAPANVNY